MILLAAGYRVVTIRDKWPNSNTVRHEFSDGGVKCGPVYHKAVMLGLWILRCTGGYCCN
jgi:hypothetical protein